MENNNSFDKLMRKLKQNPMFQLSLASSELFHSNFLYWLSLIGNKKLFKDLINELAGRKVAWPGDDDFIVSREKDHFDLSVSKRLANGKDEYIFVLENKVKGVASKEQLEKYREKTEKHNKKIANTESDRKAKGDSKVEVVRDLSDDVSCNGECAYCLLVLIEECARDCEGCKYWNAVTYKKYAGIIKKVYLDNSQLTDDFHVRIIKSYCEYIEMLSDEGLFRLPDIKEDRWEKMRCRETVKDCSDKDWNSYSDYMQMLRLDSLREKLTFNKFGEYVTELIKSEINKDNKYSIEINACGAGVFDMSYDNTIFIDYYYISKMAMVYVTKLITQNVMVRFEIHGDSYKRALIIKKDENEKPAKTKKENLTWLDKEEWTKLPDEIHDLFTVIRDKKLSEPKSAYREDVFGEFLQKRVLFGTFDLTSCVIKYQSKEIRRDSKISDVANALVKDLESVIRAPKSMS